jgi:pilus assembly protein Flp/PilA
MDKLEKKDDFSKEVECNEEKGATMIEYALMVALVAVVAILAVTFVGEEASKTFSNIGEELKAANQ